MPSFLEGIKEFANIIVGGGGGKDTTPQAEQLNNERTYDTSSPTKLHSEGVEGVRYGDSRKRPLTVESPEAAPRKKQDTRSDHEKRLLPFYSIPKNAQPIAPLQGPNSVEAGKLSRSRAMAQKSGVKTGYRPMNTLNESLHAANARKPNVDSFVSGYVNKNGVQKQDSGQTAGSKSKREIHIAPPPIQPGDGFEDDERGTDRIRFGSRKRPKLDTAPTKATPSSSLVDLTGEDEPEEMEIVGLNGKPLPQTVSRSHSGSAVVERPFGPFEAHSLKAFSSLTTIVPEKPKRKRKKGPGSSQTSSRGTPAESVNGHANPNEQASQQATNEIPKILHEELEDDKRNGTLGGERPPINLGEGVDKVKKPREQMSPEERNKDVEKAVEIVHQMSPRSGRVRGSPRGMHSQRGVGRRTIPQSPRQKDALFNNESQAPAPQRLSDMFIRDEPPRSKAKDRMKAESKGVRRRVSPIDDGQGSPDELLGGTTIRSQASRSASPQKRTGARAGKFTVNDDRKGSPSSSDPPPTQFRSGAPQNQSSDEHVETLAQAENGYHDIDRVRLQAFYATSCILTKGNLMLQYDDRERQFDLYCDDTTQVLRGKQQAVSIGKSEASKFFYSSGSHRVYLRGSSGNLSNGHICIAFLDPDGVVWFMDKLMEAIEDHLGLMPVTEDHLDKLFMKQVSDIQKRYNQEAAQHTNKEIAQAAQMKRGTDHEDEDIVYEQFHSSRQTTQRGSGRGLFEKSKYFPDLQPTRRSSRQPKLIKRSSPTPPPLRKWTKENKLQPWVHSVVYPPEGIRRVTVDFADIERLDEGNFLNDNLISFWLRRIQENISPDHREKVYFFNSFFYTALTTKNGRTSFNYDAVQRWTKTTDLLAYQYVVVPINNDMHWFVAIICNLPEVSHRAAGLTDDDEQGINGDDGTEDLKSPTTQDTDANGKASDMLYENPDDASPQPDPAPSSRTMTDGVDGVEIQAQTEAMSQLSLSQEDSKSKSKRKNLNGNGRVASLSTSEGVATPISKLAATKKSKKKAGPPLKKYDPDQPTIITLDSFGSTHSTETRNLKDYLRAEAEAKRGMDLDTKELQGMTAKGLPQQTNFCDCGLYLVGYVEEFAKDPRRFVTKVLTRQLDREADFASFDPSAKRDEIRTELLKLYDEQTADRKTKKSAKKGPAKGVAKAPASSPTPAPATSLKLQEPHMPMPPVASDEITSRIPQYEAHSKTLVRPKFPFGDREDDELEQSLPRALKEPSPLPLSSKEKVKSCTPSAKLSRENHTSQRGVRTAQDDDIIMDTTYQQEDDLQVDEESDEEMLLGTADDRDGDSAMWRSDVGQARSSPDMLSALDRKVKSDLDQLEVERVAKVAADANAAQLLNGEEAGRAIDPKDSEKPRNEREVIDLEVDDNNDLEIADSQEKHEIKPNTSRQRKRTKQNG